MITERNYLDVYPYDRWSDKVRKKYKDWDFSKKGVLRQARRMFELAHRSKNNIIVADFICPYHKSRKLFRPDFIIWLDTIKKGRFSTFDLSFEKPKYYNLRLKKKPSISHVHKIISSLKLNKIIIIISHKLETLNICDKIINLDSLNK
jgi:adenylylsulfate kinase-like enzyme